MDERELIQLAISNSEQAHAPYSNHPVGAALVSVDGRVFSGCNVESASFPAGICAERGALASAVVAGATSFVEIFIATPKGGSPCGVCRQALYEFSPSMRVVCVDFSGTMYIDATLNELLPFGFRGEDL